MFDSGCRMFLILSLLCILYVPPISAMEITDVTLFTDELNIDFPKRLLIPCHFETNEPIQNHEVTVEWGMRSEEGGSYTTLVHLFNTVLLPLDHPHKNVQLFVPLVPEGNCSLVINPTRIKDSGIYEVHISVDGVKYESVPKIKIQVFNADFEQYEDQGTASEDDLSVKDQKPKCNEFDNDILQFGRAMQKAKKSGKLIYYEVAAAIIACLMIALIISACIIGVLYYRLKKKSKAEKMNMDDIEKGPLTTVENLKEELHYKMTNELE